LRPPVNAIWSAVEKEVHVAAFDPEDEPGQGSGKEEKSVQKKRYEKPSFRWEKVFETQALACGKVTLPQCRVSRKTS
jgi:hypothetical protein